MIWYGGDYNPEQWPEEVWHEDVELMRAAGVNLVTVGVFSWARLEPCEGGYDFGWLDRALDLLGENGIKVNLATPTASPPPWFSLAYPDALPVREDGIRLVHGSRDTYCVAAPQYRERSRNITQQLLDRYGGHPALAMWHVHNEYGTACLCDHHATKFRTWLHERHGSLDALNEAWTTSFWSQHYSAWEQVMPPRATQWLPNPAHVLDYRRFLSDEMLEHYCELRDILRPSGAPITTDYVLGCWASVDHWKWSTEVDIVAIDHYPGLPGAAADEQSAFAADLARSWAGGKRWRLMEQAAGVLHSQGRVLAKEPGEIARHSMHHVEAGASGVLFFQWRASRGGAELWHHGMVPHAGRDTRVFRETAALGRTLAGLPAVEVPAPDVAIVWDDEAWWTLQSRSLPSPELDYWEAVWQAHRVLFRRGVRADFISPSADISRYRVILVPSLPLISDAAASNLCAFPGTLVVFPFTGVLDERHRVRLAGHPGASRRRLGIRVEEFRPLAEPVSLSDGSRGRSWSELVNLEGASVVTSYPDSTPAITRKRQCPVREHRAGRRGIGSTALRP